MTEALDQPVLVLNRLWQPIQTTSARRAVKLLFLGHAQVVETEGEHRFQTHDLSSWVEHSSSELLKSVSMDDMIRTVKIAMRVPKIIVLGLYDKLPRMEVKFSRQNVFLRDKYTCQYCIKKLPEVELNLDHVMPRDKGGQTTWENIVTSCISCNTRKGNRLPDEVNMIPHNKPVAPRWRPLYGFTVSKVDQAWSHFLPC